MERKIILQTKEQCIYLMKDTNLDFYLIIPNSRMVSIVLGIFPNMNDNDIKTLPKDNDKVIVIPVINDNILTLANHLDTVSFKYLDNVLSYLINTTYKILTHNHIEVSKKVLLNNHSMYTNFNNKYLEKYAGRVELYNLLPRTAPETIASATEVFSPVSATTIIPQFKPNEPLFKDANPTEIEKEIDKLVSTDVYNEISTSPNTNTYPNTDNKEPGFVSYILLGVLGAVFALIGLYMIL